jgi:hypothetical protein
VSLDFGFGRAQRACVLGSQVAIVCSPRVSAADPDSRS